MRSEECYNISQFEEKIIYIRRNIDIMNEYMFDAKNKYTSLPYVYKYLFIGQLGAKATI